MRIRLFSQYLYAPLLWLAIVDAVLAIGAVHAGVYLRFNQAYPGGEVDAVSSVWQQSIVFALVVSLVATALALYSTRQRAGAIGIFGRILLAVLAGAAALALVGFLVPVHFIGRGSVFFAVLIALVLVSIARAVFQRVFFEEQAFQRRVLVYGAGRQAQTIANVRRRADMRGFRIVGYVPSGEETPLVPEDMIRTPGPRLADYARRAEIDEIVVAMDDRRQNFPIAELLDCRLAGYDITDIQTFFERETGRVRLDVLNPSWIIFGEGFQKNWLRGLTARSFDVVASLALLALAWPVLLFTWFAMKLEEGWTAPFIYRQIRVGLLGEPFLVLKVRSMRIDAEAGGAKWATTGDPRVTRAGAWIRKFRIDELPQLINVLKGDMSFVGPRPERPEFVEQLQSKIPYYKERHWVKPGITGWAQLCYPYGASERDAFEKLQYDLYYVKNQSFLFDLMILLQTAEVILWRKGAR